MTSGNSPGKLEISWRRWFKLGAWTLVIGYVVVLVSFTLLQRYLIYVPTRLPLATAEETAAKSGFVPWLDAAGQLMGWKLSADRKSVV